MANLGPSEKLLRNISISWSEFSRRYRKEMFESGGVDKNNKTIKNHGQKFTLRMLQQLGKRSTITLLCHCDESQKECHRHVLRKMLMDKI